jgi:hypothetical protein
MWRAPLACPWPHWRISTNQKQQAPTNASQPAGSLGSALTQARLLTLRCPLFWFELRSDHESEITLLTDWSYASFQGHHYRSVFLCLHNRNTPHSKTLLWLSPVILAVAPSRQLADLWSQFCHLYGFTAGPPQSGPVPLLRWLGLLTGRTSFKPPASRAFWWLLPWGCPSLDSRNERPPVCRAELLRSACI